jgi:hypothetical protein
MVEHTRAGGEDRTVVGFEAWTRDLALEDHELDCTRIEDVGIASGVGAPFVVYL